MILIRSLLFKILFPVWTCVCCSFYYPLVWMKVSSKTLAISGRSWANVIIVLLRYVCGIRHEIRGLEHLPQGPCIIACQHQSVWDTMIFLKLLDHPAYILKQELLNIPLFGTFLKGLEMIAVDRSGGSAALKTMVADVKKRLDDNRTVVIFPEGTRVFPGEKKEYQPGIAFLYNDADIQVPIIPAALNSGAHWNKLLPKIPGTIVLEFLPAIEKGLKRKEFMSKLQEIVVNTHKKL